MLPDGWKEVKWAEISSIITKGATPTTYGFPFVEKGLNTARFIGGNNCTTNGKFNPSGEKWISQEANFSQKRSCLRENDIVICIVGNVGNNFLVSKQIIPANINQNVAKVSIDARHADFNYIFQCVNSNLLKSQLLSEITTQAQPSVSLKQIGNLKTLLPPLPEQKKIAAILSTWDRAIEGTEKLLSNSQQQKKALMQQLLTGKKRLPGFTGEWKFHTLSELAAMSSGGTPLSTQKAYFGGNIPWVSIADMTRCGKYISQTEKTLTKSGLDNSSAKLYPKNTVLYAMYASIGECSIASTELSCSQAILGIRTNSKLYFEYLYFYLGFLKEKIKLLGQTGTQSNLNAKMVKAFRINLPPLPEQKAIAAVLSTSDEEITALESDLARLRQEKKALMQQLLTGKIRVAV